MVNKSDRNQFSWAIQIPPSPPKRKVTLLGGFLFYWRGIWTTKCNSPVNCCRRRLDGGEPLFFAKRKMQKIPPSPPSKKNHPNGWFFLFKGGGIWTIAVQYAGDILLEPVQTLVPTFVFAIGKNATNPPFSLLPSLLLRHIGCSKIFFLSWHSIHL